MKDPINFLYEMTGDVTEEDLRVSLSVDYDLNDIIDVMEKYADYYSTEMLYTIESNSWVEPPGIVGKPFYLTDSVDWVEHVKVYDTKV